MHHLGSEELKHATTAVMEALYAVSDDADVCPNCLSVSTILSLIGTMLGRGEMDTEGLACLVQDIIAVAQDREMLMAEFEAATGGRTIH